MAQTAEMTGWPRKTGRDARAKREKHAEMEEEGVVWMEREAKSSEREISLYIVSAPDAT